MSISKNKTYNIYNKTTGELLSSAVLGSDARIVENALIDIGYDVVVKETASGGSTGGSSIAVNMDVKKKHSIKEFMKQFQSKIKNKAPKPMYITVTESFDMESVFSRLSSMEKSGSTKKTEGTTFGVEDDQGNLMKVTVRSDQAKAFEDEIATYLANVKVGVVGMPLAKGATEVSIAELLFKLKDKFDIIDVDFPKIPTDIVYNAEKASPAGHVDKNLAGNDLNDTGELNGEENANNPNGPLDLTNYEQPDDVEGKDNHDMEDMDDMENMDDESVEDFPSEPEDNEGSILNQVIIMLKAQAEAETAKANAQAESARADQAKYAAQATQQVMKDKEEELRYELEMDAQKKSQKEADKMADMAKHKLSRAMSMRENINEMDIGTEPSAAIMKERQVINQQFAVLPDDDDGTKTYKMRQKAEAIRLLGSRYRIAVNKERFDAVMKQKGKTSKQQNPNQNQQQNPNQNQQQNPNQNQQQNPNQNQQQNPNQNQQQNPNQNQQQSRV